METNHWLYRIAVSTGYLKGSIQIQVRRQFKHNQSKYVYYCHPKYNTWRIKTSGVLTFRHYNQWGSIISPGYGTNVIILLPLFHNPFLLNRNVSLLAYVKLKTKLVKYSTDKTIIVPKMIIWYHQHHMHNYNNNNSLDLLLPHCEPTPQTTIISNALQPRS